MCSCVYASSQQAVGRGAFSVLDPLLSHGFGQHKNMSFDEGFSLYGGAAAADELEEIATTCARVCSRYVAFSF